MKIYVDADSCPKPVKKILFRLAHRTGIIILFVANKAIIAPRLTNIKTIEVGKGIDKADEYILEKMLYFSQKLTSWVFNDQPCECADVGHSRKIGRAAKIGCEKIGLRPGLQLWRHGSDCIYTKNSARPGSDFIYTKNSAIGRSDFFPKRYLSWVCMSSFGGCVCEM